VAKNIIICSDGTGNTAIKNRGTNVFKLFEAVDLNGHRTNPSLDAQVAMYDDGVGTQSFLPLKLLGGAFGFGLARNVRKLYMELVRIYDPGDRIYLFGFSRGAFTARTLCGMIAKCGVLDRDKLTTTDQLQSAVSKAYKTYRCSYRTWIQSFFHMILSWIGLRRSDLDVLEEFRKIHSLDYDVGIRFVGVWDTVDAVGGPFHTSDVINALFHRFKFPDHKLSGKVDFACHALAVDESRAAFQPLLWESDSRIEQVWFAGVHSNVGGGYPKQGMSLVALDWMLRAANERGLRVVGTDSDYYAEHTNADDKLYDSRAGLGVFYRWKPRDMRRLCDKQKAGLPPVVHLSVLERIAHGTDGYNPGTLAPQVNVTFTRGNQLDPITGAQENTAAGQRAQAVETAFLQAFEKRGASLDKARHTLSIGRVAYYLYVASCVAILLGASLPKDGGSITTWVLLKSAAILLSNVVTGQWGQVMDSVEILITRPWMLGIPLLGFVVSALLAMYVDQFRSATFSRFWHTSRQELRTALKESKKRMQAAAGE
jgi:uncharacterized protein (DUF2235 family)